MDPAGPSPDPYRIPEFELIRSIGHGAFGDVWLARNVLGGYRAVKLVFRQKSGLRFEREFEGIRLFAEVCLGNPGQLPILHIGKREEDGFFFYVMELADDVVRRPKLDPVLYEPLTLEAERKRRRHTIEEVIRIGITLGESLAYLHGRGLVHRDVKPSNVVVVGGVYKLADVGLMEVSAADSKQIGTAGYVPSQGAGTPSADAYALGKVLYELANGRDRMDFPSLSPPRTRGELVNEFPQLNQIVLRACDPDPAHRYEDIREMVEELRLLLIPRVQRRIRALKSATALSLVMLAAALGVASAAYWQAGRFAEEAYGAQLNQANLALSVTNFARARALLDTQTNRLIDPRGFEWYALRTEAEGDPCLQLQRGGPDVTSLRFHPDGRRLLGHASLGGDSGLHEVIEWDLTKAGAEVRVRSTNAPIGLDLAGHLWVAPPGARVAFGPAGKREEIPAGPVVFPRALISEPFRDLAQPGTMGSKVPATWVDYWTAQLDPGPRLCLAKAIIPGGSADETPFAAVIGDGADPRLVVATIRGRNHNASMAVVSFRASGGSPWRVGYPHAVLTMRISPDGRRVAVANQGEKDLDLYEAESGRTLWSAGLHFGSLTTLVFSPDGTLLASGADDAVVVVSRVVDGSVVRKFVGLSGKVRALAWNTAGTSLAGSSVGGDVRVWSLTDPPRLGEISGFSIRDGGGLAFSRDGNRIAVSNPDDSVSVLPTTNLTHRERIPGIFFPLTFDSDNTLIGYDRSGRAVRASLRPPFEVQRGVVLVPRTNLVLEISSAVATGPGDRWILVAGTDGSERLWSGYDGELVWSDLVPPPTDWPSNPGMVYAARDVERALVSHRWGKIRVLDTSARPTRGRVLFEASTFNRLQAAYLSPDGSWYAVANDAGQTGVARVGEAPGDQVIISSSELYSMTFVDRGGRLVGGTGNGDLQIYSMDPLKPVTLISAVDAKVRHGTYDVRQLVLSRDERWLAARTVAGTIRVWDLR